MGGLRVVASTQGKPRLAPVAEYATINLQANSSKGILFGVICTIIHNPQINVKNQRNRNIGPASNRRPIGDNSAR